MRPLRAGELRHRVTIKGERQIDDGHGGQKLEWQVVVRDWPCKIEPLSGNEAVVARQLQDTITHKVTGRYVPGISGRLAIEWGERLLNIREVRNLEEGNRVLELRCEEGVAT